jgi:hypothetical protein
MGTLVLIVSGVSHELAASDQGMVISRLLEKLSQSSPQLSINQKRTSAQNVLLSKGLNQFEYTGAFDIARTQNQPAPTSPFVPTESETNELTISGSKLWQNGLRANLSYTVQDQFTEFAARQNFSFISPSLQLQFDSKLFQDIFGKRYQHQVKNIKSQNSYNNLQDQIFRKGVLVQALLSYANILEKQEELKLQRELCKKTKIQNMKLRQKRKRLSASRREFLQSQKEFNNCQAIIQNLEKQVFESKTDFEANYFVQLEPFLFVNSDKLFQEVQQLYSSLDAQKDSQYDFEKQDDVQLLSLRLSALGEKQSELEAQTKSDLNLQVRVGSTSADNSYADASSDVFGFEYPFVYAGVSLALPLKNRNSSKDAAANMYEIRAAQEQKKLTINQKMSRLSTLIDTLKKDFLIYERYSSSVDIGKQIIFEANKDYSNGRISYNTYTDFNKSLIQDQKVLSSHRIRVIIRAIEFLDFYRFFDAYVGGNK